MSTASSLFGYVNTMNILQEIEPPNLNAGPGKLVFKQSTNGTYSVKKAYGLLTINQQQGDTDLTGVWEAIWHKGDVAPRIRMFMWKLMHDGLSLAATLNRRFPNISTACAIYGDTDENVSHLTHKCQFARACHFAGPIALRTDTLPQSFPDAVEYLIGLMDDLQWTRYANSLWALWRCRNDVVYGGKAVGLQDFNNYLSTVMWESHLMASQGSKIRITEVQAIDLNIQDFEYCCNVDGSWLKEWEGGIGVFLKRNEELILYKSAKVRGCCSMQLEARALWEAVKLVIQMGISNCIFLSDNKTLVELVSQNSPPSNIC